MKKLFFVAVAALTLGFASCSEKAQQDEAATVIENLKAQLEAGDASGVQAALEGVQGKVAELLAKDPEAAKTYVTKIQDFVKENKEKITAVIGENAAAQVLVNTLVDTPADVVINTLTAGQSVIDNAKATADSAAQAVQDGLEQAAQSQVDNVEAAVNEQVDAAKQKANDEVNNAKQKANDEVNKAAQKANEEINKAAGDALKSLGL